jgi:glycosyltransferase involved in cell wall biosynthesis
VTVICRRDPGNSRLPGVDVVDYPAPRDAASKLGFVREYGWSFVMTAVGLLRVARRTGFDALQVCGAPDIYFCFGLLGRVFGKPMVYDQRDPSPELYEARYGRSDGVVHRVLHLLEAATYRSADHVVTVNDTLADMARTRGRVPPDRTTIVRNGPVLAATAGHRPVPELRHGRAHLCCWVGAMGPQDHLEIAVFAVNDLVHRQGRQDCHFTFVGDGESRDDAMRLSRDLGLEEFVSFPGFLSQDAVFDHLATADVGLDPGLDHTVSPVKALEFMAFGVPFVAFDLREVRVMAEGAALFTTPGDHEDMARLVGRLLDDPAERRRLGEVGLRRVGDSLAWDHQQPRYVAVFDRLLGGRGSERGCEPDLAQAANRYRTSPTPRQTATGLRRMSGARTACADDLG